MHRFGWMFIALGALLLLGKGIFFLPLFLLPLFFVLPFMMMGRRHFGGGWGGYGRGGMRPYHWRGRQGYYSRGSCGGPRYEAREAPPEARGPYTGETTRL